MFVKEYYTKNEIIKKIYQLIIKKEELYLYYYPNNNYYDYKKFFNNKSQIKALKKLQNDFHFLSKKQKGYKNYLYYELNNRKYNYIDKKLDKSKEFWIFKYTLSYDIINFNKLNYQSYLNFQSKYKILSVSKDYTEILVYFEDNRDDTKIIFLNYILNLFYSDIFIKEDNYHKTYDMYIISFNLLQKIIKNNLLY